MSVEGYFRLVAKDWSYNGTSETLLLGRLHKAVDNDTDFISIGEMKTLSRKHAIIKWHSELGKWTITCLSKNGMFIDNVKYEGADEVQTSGSKMAVLKDRSKVTFGELDIFFLYPELAPAV